MNLAQDITLPTPRTPTQAEDMAWKRFKERYAQATSSVRALLSTAEVAATFQDWATRRNLPLTCWEGSDQGAIDGILARYNTLGRLIQGCEMEKYFASLQDGDITILAPAGMPAEQYQGDLYPNTMDADLGVLWVPIVIGVALVVGAIVVSETIDYVAKKKDDEFRKKIINADLEMLKAPKDVQDAWRQMKATSKDLIEVSNKQHKGTWLDSLIPGGIGGLAGVGLAILGLLIAYRITGKERSDYA